MANQENSQKLAEEIVGKLTRKLNSKKPKVIGTDYSQGYFHLTLEQEEQQFDLPIMTATNATFHQGF